MNAFLQAEGRVGTVSGAKAGKLPLRIGTTAEKWALN